MSQQQEPRLLTTSVMPMSPLFRKGTDAPSSPVKTRAFDWSMSSFFIGVGQALLLFSSPRQIEDATDVEAVSADLETVLNDFARVLQRHGHVLEATGVKTDVA